LTKKRDGCGASLVLLALEFNSTECEALGAENDKIFNQGTVDQNALATACANQCIDKIRALILSAVATCKPSYFAGSLKDLKNLFRFLALIRLPCIQYNGEFCLPKLKAFFDSKPTITANSQDSDIDAFCHPCLRKFLIVVAYITQNDTVIQSFACLQFICIQSMGHYCYLQFLKINAATDTNSKLAIACQTRCLSKIVLFWTLYNPDQIAQGYTELRALAYLCTKNAAGAYCFTTLSAVSNGNATDPCADLSNGCPSACQSHLSSVSSQMGCCFRSFLNLIIAQGGTNVTLDQINAYIGFVSNLCKVQFADACKTKLQSKVQFALTLKGIADAYWASAARRDLLIRKIRNDILRSYGIEDVSCTATTSTFTSGQTATITVCDILDDGATAAIALEANTDISSGNQDLSETQSTTDSDSVDSGAGTDGSFATSDPTVGTSSTGSATVINAKNSASSVVLSLVLLIASFAFLL